VYCSEKFDNRINPGILIFSTEKTGAIISIEILKNNRKITYELKESKRIKGNIKPLIKKAKEFKGKKGKPKSILNDQE
jgi:hypothetical protein